MKIHFLWVLLLITLRAVADNVTVYNETTSPLAVRVYIKKGTRADAFGPVIMLEDGTAGIVTRPARKLFYDREIRFVHKDQASVLDSVLRDNELQTIPFCNIGSLEGTVFYLTQEDSGTLRGYSDSLWNKLVSPLQEWKKRVQREGTIAVLHNRYKDTAAFVRSGGIAPEELNYLKKRLPTVKKACAALELSVDDMTTPLVAVVMSGGGYRAATAAAGSVAGLDDAGLLDTVSWIVGLSGSSWYLASWYTSTLSADNFVPYLQEAFSKHLFTLNEKGFNHIINAIAVQQYFKQEVTFIDIYGALLAEKLFYDKPNPEDMLWSQVTEQLENAPEKWPFPMCTAIYQSASRNIRDSLWYEMTPYEVGSLKDGLFIPTWSFGRTFNKGQSIDTIPEKSLGFLCGMWG